MDPDTQLVYEAQRVIKASNVHTIAKCLKWYEHWCHVGNVAATEMAARRLRQEVQEEIVRREQSAKMYPAS